MKISIVIPTYNRAHLLPRAIDSVSSQDYPDWELVVVDDASTDGTAEVIQPFLSSRVTYVRFDSNKGVSAARNAGVAAATGEWIGFLDSDDAYLPGALSTIASEAQRVPTETGMLFFPIEMYREDGSFIGTRGYLPSRDWQYHVPSYEDLLLKRGIENDMHRVYRAATIKPRPFDERIRDHDTILYAAIAKEGVGCLYVNKSVVRVYAGRDDHLSHGRRDPVAWHYIYSLYFRDHLAALKAAPGAYGAMCLGMGLCCLKLGKPEALAWFARGFFHDPAAFVRVALRNARAADRLV